MLLGLLALGWAIVLPSGGCVRLASDVSGCTDDMPVKRAIGGSAVLLLVVPALLMWRVSLQRRR